MRILAIRGCNLASLEGEFAIDFEAEPLSSAGIFAITGPTGAGKSTLLDAMCLALFEELPRLWSARSGEVGLAGGEAISARDVRAIMRHRAGEAFAEVDFVGRDRARYRARWSVRRARKRADGQLQNSEMSFTNLDTGAQMGGTRTETKKIIVEKIGLTAEQFSRAVMLAQGDFDAFVRADFNERAILLERLTGTEVYARLGVAARRKGDLLREGMRAIQLQIEAQHGLGDDARAEAEARLDQARSAHGAAATALEALKRDRDWYDRAAALSLRASEARAALEKARGTHLEAEPRRLVLKRRQQAAKLVLQWTSARDAVAKAAHAASNVERHGEQLAVATRAEAEAAEKVVLAQDAMIEAKRELEAVRPELERAQDLDRQLARLADDVARSRNEHTEADSKAKDTEQLHAAALESERTVKATLEEHDAWLVQNRGRETLASRFDDLLGDLAEFGEKAKLTGQLGRDLKVAVASQDLAQEALRQAAASAEQAKNSHDVALAALEAARARAPEVGALAALSDERDKMAKVGPSIAVVERERTRLASIEASIETNRGDTAACAAVIDTTRAGIATIDAAAPALRARLDEARRAGALSAAAASEAAERIRGALVSGEPCPVCGSLDHPTGALAALIDDRVANDEARCAALEDQVSEEGRKAAVLRDRLGNAERRHQELAGELGRHREALSEARVVQEQASEALGAAVAACGLEPDLDLAALQRVVDERIGQIDAARAELQRTQQELDRARTDEEQARALHDAAKEAQRSAADRAREATQAAQALAGRRDDAATNLDRLGAELDGRLEGHFEWRTERDPKVRLTALVAEWREHREAHDVAAQAMPVRLAATHDADILRQQARTAADAIANVAAGHERRHGVLADERKTLLGGEVAAVVAQRLDTAVQRTSTDHEEARTGRETTRNTVAAAQAALKQCQREHAACVSDRDKHARVIEERLAAAGMDDEEVAREAGAEEGVLEAEAEALAALEQEVAVKSAEADSRAADRDVHAASEAPTLSGEELTTALASAASEEDLARETMTEAEIVIRRDDDARVATTALRAALNEAKADAGPWLRLEELIGDASGNKFRRFAQGLTLDRLVAHANDRLHELQPRYSLERGTGGEMMLQVVDHELAGEVRGLQNLSGGERFLVSLALALGLAEMSTGRGLRIESLFIDEGFGALDSASLGSALALLEQLHATGRKVGVISHIDEVKERIPVKVAVTPIARGRSKVETLLT